MIKKGSTKAPMILSEVASLTSIRDIEIFEFSFLRTLAEMLKVQDICIYKFNNIHEPCRLLRYSSETEKTDSKHSVAEFKEIQVADIKVPEEIKRAQDWIESTDRIYSVQKDDLFYMVYPIAGLQGIVGYLSINLYKQLTETENLVITSLLSISHNFHSLLEENQKDKLTGLLNRKTFDENVSKIQTTLNSIHQADSYSGNEKRAGLTMANIGLQF